VAFSPKKGRLLFASVGLDNAVKLNELIPQQAINEPAGNARAPVLAVSVDSTGQLLTAVDTGSGVRISALEGGGQGGFTLGPVTASLAFSLDGTHLAVGETGGQARLVEVPGGEQVNTFRVASTAIESVALSKDGGQLAASYCSVIGVSRGNQPICTTSVIQVWDVSSQKPALTLEENLGVVSSLAFDPLGRFLVSGSTSNGIQLWELPSGTAHGVPLGASFVGVTSLAFSPDGAVLAAGYADQTIALWDIDTHQAIGEPLTGAPENVLSLAFTLDGTKLLSGSLDGTLLYWDVSLDSWVSKVCDLAGRNLSNTEWEQFFPYQTYRKTCPQFQEGG
jgi:WD40 repeat protein